MYFADVALVLRLEGVPEVVFRDLAAKNNPREAREVIMQACPKSCIDNLVAKIIRHLEMPYGIQVPSRSIGVKAMNIEV